MGFREAVLPWLDCHGLMGRRPNPPPLEEGNPILETANAYALMHWLVCERDSDSHDYWKAMSALEKMPGLPNKKPGSSDLVTHDDLIGWVVGSKAMGLDLHVLMVRYAMLHGWEINNTERWEFESEVKPWHRAFYMLSAGYDPGLFDKLMLAGSIIADAFTNMDSASDKRLTYIMLKSLDKSSTIVALAGLVWFARIRRVYGSVRRVYVKLKGEQHPFSVYCPD